MDPHELEERKHLAHEDADRLKQDLPRIELERLSRDGDGSRPAERDSEPGETRHISEQPNPIRSADRER